MGLSGEIAPLFVCILPFDFFAANERLFAVYRCNDGANKGKGILTIKIRKFLSVSFSRPNGFAQRTMAVTRLARTNRLYRLKCSEILAHVKLLYNPRVNKVFTSLHTSEKKRMPYTFTLYTSILFLKTITLFVILCTKLQK